jgi:hypothetical protein
MATTSAKEIVCLILFIALPSKCVYTIPVSESWQGALSFETARPLLRKMYGEKRLETERHTLSSKDSPARE